MNANEIAHFLKANPGFFDQHPDLLEGIFVPHPHGGRAISLAERQLVTLREKGKLLENKLLELIRFGEENEAISEKVHRLCVALLGARDVAGATNALYFHMREDFSVPHVVLRVWGRPQLEGQGEGAPVSAQVSAQVSDTQRDLAQAMAAPQCGAAAGHAFAGWFGDASEHVRSLALLPLGATSVIGLLALGSEDARRFYPEMGTLYLRRIGEAVTAALASRT